jgi:hypothetical protein
MYINLTLKNDSSLLHTPVRELFNVGVVAPYISFLKMTVVKLTFSVTSGAVMKIVLIVCWS